MSERCQQADCDARPDGLRDFCDEHGDFAYMPPRKLIEAQWRKAMRATEIFWHCPDCLSIDVQEQVWKQVNSNMIVDSCHSYHWCSECEVDHSDGEKKGLVTTVEVIEHAIEHKGEEVAAFFLGLGWQVTRRK